MNITDGLTRWAQERPDDAAVIHNGRVFTFAQLETATLRAVAWFRRQGVVAGDVVGMTLAGSLVHLLAAFGLARMGALQLSLPPFEPLELRRDIARRAGARLVVGDGDPAGELGLPVLRPDSSWLTDRVPSADELGPADPGGARPWAIVSSSGTTGRPKLFPYRHDTELMRARRLYPRLADRPGTRVLRLSPIAFIASKRFYLTWIGAGHVAVLESRAQPPHYETIIETIRRHEVEVLSVTPLQLERLLVHCPPGTRRMPSLVALTTGTTIVTEQLRQAARSRIAPHALVNYGANEVGTITLAEPEDQDRHPGTIGRPVEGVELQIVDEQGRALPVGEVGLIRVRGEGMSGHYLDDPEADARVWRDGWYQPGDLGALTEDGNVIFHGRSDDVINRDGIKIYPTEIETVLLTHPAVAEAAAFPVTGSSGQQMPMAAVVLRMPVDDAALLAFARTRLGVRAPRRVIALPSLPRNSFGKVLKRELGEQMAAAPESRSLPASGSPD